MSLTLEFIKLFFIGLFYAVPLLSFFLLLIILLGQRIGRREGWSRFDSFYYSMITATTVGYGDFRPVRRASRLMAIVIALLGLLLTGLLVSIGVQAASVAFKSIYAGNV